MDGRRIQVRAYPISISVDEIRRIANSPRALEYAAKAAVSMCNEHTISKGRPS